jgi:hypothetical protein
MSETRTAARLPLIAVPNKHVNSSGGGLTPARRAAYAMNFSLMSEQQNRTFNANLC